MTYFSSFLRSDLSKNQHFTYMIVSNDLIRCWINEMTKYIGIMTRYLLKAPNENKDQNMSLAIQRVNIVLHIHFRTFSHIDYIK